MNQASVAVGFKPGLNTIGGKGEIGVSGRSGGVEGASPVTASAATVSASAPTSHVRTLFSPKMNRTRRGMYFLLVYEKPRGVSVVSMEWRKYCDGAMSKNLLLVGKENVI